MGFIDTGRVMIRVAANELQPKDANPNVPYTAEEVAASAIAAAHAGASIVHVHSRTADGAQALADDRAGADIYRDLMARIARESDVLVEPTNFPHGGDPSLAGDTPHFWSLADDPPAGASLEVVNIDGFRFAHSRVAYVHGRGLRPIENRAIDLDGRVALPEVVEETLRRGLVPFFGVFELSDVRLLAHWAREGLLPRPVMLQINFFCDLMKGPTPGVHALKAFLDEWPRDEIDSEICVFARALPDRKTYDGLFDAALERGVHMRVGLGDNPHLFPGATNADLVAHAQERIAHHGFRAVTAAELRTRMGIGLP
jgi:3-keto-5-aminohexanoate cleavage enzyme